MKKLIYILGIVIGLAACSNHSDDEHSNITEEHAHESMKTTIWNDNVEMFAEYPELIKNKDAEFLIHLTDMDKMEPIENIEIKIEFTGTEKFIPSKILVEKPGIFGVPVKFMKAGKYNLAVSFIYNNAEYQFNYTDFTVAENEGEVKHNHSESTGQISFLKEQQWRMDFATEPVQYKSLQNNIKVNGELMYKPGNFAKICSPLSGLISSKNFRIPDLGSYVKKGQILIIISPGADYTESISRIKNDYLLAKKELERAVKLYEGKAISQKRLDETKADFEAKKSVFDSLDDQVQILPTGMAIKSPIDGYIENINVSVGARINTGDEMFTVGNSRQLILKANVPASQVDAGNKAENAVFKVEGFTAEFDIKKMGGRKISEASSLDIQSRTMPVYFELNNTSNILKAGMFAEVFILYGSKAESLVVPKSAIVNEDGLKTVYVQLEGESFEKRIIRTGSEEGNYVQVIEGLKGDERIVIRGAYQVRLASLGKTASIGDGHNH